jgi:hypothetical protein
MWLVGWLPRLDADSPLCSFQISPFTTAPSVVPQASRPESDKNPTLFAWLQSTRTFRRPQMTARCQTSGFHSTLGVGSALSATSRYSGFSTSRQALTRGLTRPVKPVKPFIVDHHGAPGPDSNCCLYVVLSHAQSTEYQNRSVGSLVLSLATYLEVFRFR